MCRYAQQEWHRKKMLCPSFAKESEEQTWTTTGDPEPLLLLVCGAMLPPNGNETNRNRLKSRQISQSLKPQVPYGLDLFPFCKFYSSPLLMRRQVAPSIHEVERALRPQRTLQGCDTCMESDGGVRAFLFSPSTQWEIEIESIIENKESKSRPNST